MKSRVMTLFFALFLCMGSNVAWAAQPKVAVTLAGGVARGFAFLGALEVLVTEGVPVDQLVGTSAGALVSGLYASGYSFKTLEELLSELQYVQSDLVQVLFPPTAGLLDPTGFEVMYRELVGGIRLEQTSPPLAIMATELRPAAPKAITTGDLASAMRASISLPLLFPVAQINDTYYIDGGLRDPFPVSVARGLGFNFIIGVRSEPEPNAKPDQLMGALGLVVNALTVPVDQPQPDYAIRIKTYDTLYFDFTKVRDLMQRGRERARTILPELKQKLEAAGIGLNPKGDPHENNPINAQWRSKFEAGLRAVRALPRPFTVAPVLDLAPSAFDWGTRPGSPDGFSSFAIGANLTGGALGNFSIGAGYVERLNDTADNFFARASFDFQPFRLEGAYDPARRPVSTPWELALEYRGGSFNDAPFTARLAVDRVAVTLGSKYFERTPTYAWNAELELRFGYAPSLRAQTTLGFEWLFASPFLLRSRAVFGLTTGGAQPFSLGYNSLIRAFPANAVLAPQAVILNLEFAYRLNALNVLGLLTAVPELRVFFDAGFAINVNQGSSLLLGSLGIGVYVPGQWFGFFSFGVGADIAFGLPGARVLVYTNFPLMLGR